MTTKRESVSKRTGWYRVLKALNAEQGDIPGIRQRTDKQRKGAIIPARWLDLCDDATFDFLLRSDAEQGMAAIEAYSPSPAELEVLHLLYPAAFDRAPKRGKRGAYPRRRWLRARKRFYVPETAGETSAGTLIQVPNNGYQIVPGALVDCLSDDAYALAQSTRWDVFQTTHVKPDLAARLQAIWSEPESTEPDPEPDTPRMDTSENDSTSEDD